MQNRHPLFLKISWHASGLALDQETIDTIILSRFQKLMSRRTAKGIEISD